MLEIKDLHVKIEDKEILKGVTLTVNPGEVHSIMGPNGSGKSTLSQVLAGKESYEVTSGSITFKGKNLLELAPEERACEGIFMAFQYPAQNLFHPICKALAAVPASGNSHFFFSLPLKTPRLQTCLTYFHLSSDFSSFL